MITHAQCKLARVHLNLTQPALAKLVGVNKNTIHTWEKGKTALHPILVAEVERVLTKRGIVFSPNNVGWRPAEGRDATPDAVCLA
jgi:DNA-binding XRE family transcriptional regulator